MNLTDRRFLVTGAASGIGRQTALTLARKGAKILLLDIDREGVMKVANQIGDAASYITYDLSDFTGNLRELLLKDVEHNGAINGFVHCAGLAYISPVGQIKIDKVHKVIDVNTLAALELTKIITRKEIRADNSCANVLISSVYGIVGSPANAAYAISKGGIIALTKALAIEYAPKSIRFNCIAPGFVRTEMLEKGSGSFDNNYVKNLEALHPLGLGKGDDIADPIAFLLSDDARWITGAVLPVDGGFTAR